MECERHAVRRNVEAWRNIPFFFLSAFCVRGSVRARRTAQTDLEALIEETSFAS